MIQHKIPRWLMINSAGKPDAMWTLTFIAFIITTVMYVSSFLKTVTIGTASFTFSTFSIDYAGVVLVPLLMAYFGRRYTTAKLSASLEHTQLIAKASKQLSGSLDESEVSEDEVLR